MLVTKEVFGQIGERTVDSYMLMNDHGLKVTCITYGCIITKIMAPDKNGISENIVIGYDTLDEYVNDRYFLGTVVGRVAGRIKGGTFDLDGETFSLAKNENNNHLHGGLKGFNRVIWDAEPFEHNEEVGVCFSYLSPNGEEGYPGNLKVTVTYSLNNHNELAIRYNGLTDKKTIVNMTNHSYFNLSGELKRDILGHHLKIKSEQFLELNNELLPTGNFLDVAGTPFDFTAGKFIQAGADSEHPQNKLVGHGYDHPFLLKINHNQEIVLMEPESGRSVTIETDEPSVVVYTSNQMDSKGEFRGISSRRYLGICLETQGLPDAVHHPEFPSWVLEPSQLFESVSKYKFEVTLN